MREKQINSGEFIIDLKMQIDDIHELDSVFSESKDIFDQLIRNSPYLGYSGNHNYHPS